MMHNSLTILTESLEKKISILSRLQAFNEEQEKCFQADEPDLEGFDSLVEQKDQLIDELLRLDDGFESLYDEVKVELDQNRALYKPQIAQMQDQIRRITELTNAVQIKEARNKKLVEDFFQKRRGGIKQGRQQSRAAMDYYKSMSGSGVRQSSLWDSKQ